VTDDVPVAEQLAAIAATGRWRKWRKLEIVCAGCGDTLVDVIATQPWVITTRRRDGGRHWNCHPLDGEPGEPGTSTCRCQTVHFTRGDIQRHLDAGTRRVVHPAKLNTQRGEVR
jgi:hypothetical protein